jgi:hypothetical protein
VNRCDVVIVNFNGGEFLTAAVESVLRSTSVAHVYVVDNASTDGSLDLRGCGGWLSVQVATQLSKLTSRDRVFHSICSFADSGPPVSLLDLITESPHITIGVCLVCITTDRVDQL